MNMDLLKKLCLANGVSSGEDEIRNIIISEIDGYADEIAVDKSGNIIVFKKGVKGRAELFVGKRLNKESEGLHLEGIIYELRILCYKNNAAGGIFRTQPFCDIHSVDIGELVIEKDNIKNCFAFKKAYAIFKFIDIYCYSFFFFVFNTIIIVINRVKTLCITLFSIITYNSPKMYCKMKKIQIIFVIKRRKTDHVIVQ